MLDSVAAWGPVDPGIKPVKDAGRSQYREYWRVRGRRSGAGQPGSSGTRGRGIRHLVGFLVVVLAVACLLPCGALADGDPASDVLLAANVFYPYQPPVPAGVQRNLNALTAAAQKRGFPIKVALIANPVDLGVIPELFGKPQQYANFLEQEISFQGRQLLLVVMATGYGVQGLPAASTHAIAGLPRPSGKSSTALAQAAITAVSRAAAAAGHPVGDAGASSSGTGNGGSTTPIVIGLVVVAVLAAGGLIALRRRQPARPV